MDTPRVMTGPSALLPSPSVQAPVVVAPTKTEEGQDDKAAQASLTGSAETPKRRRTLTPPIMDTDLTTNGKNATARQPLNCKKQIDGLPTSPHTEDTSPNLRDAFSFAKAPPISVAMKNRHDSTRHASDSVTSFCYPDEDITKRSDDTKSSSCNLAAILLSTLDLVGVQSAISPRPTDTPISSRTLPTINVLDVQDTFQISTPITVRDSLTSTSGLLKDDKSSNSESCGENGWGADSCGTRDSESQFPCLAHGSYGMGPFPEVKCESATITQLLSEAVAIRAVVANSAASQATPEYCNFDISEELLDGSTLEKKRSSSLAASLLQDPLIPLRERNILSKTDGDAERLQRVLQYPIFKNSIQTPSSPGHATPIAQLLVEHLKSAHQRHAASPSTKMSDRIASNRHHEWNEWPFPSETTSGASPHVEQYSSCFSYPNVLAQVSKCNTNSTLPYEITHPASLPSGSINAAEFLTSTMPPRCPLSQTYPLPRARNSNDLEIESGLKPSFHQASHVLQHNISEGIPPKASAGLPASRSNELNGASMTINEQHKDDASPNSEEITPPNPRRSTKSLYSASPDSSSCNFHQSPRRPTHNATFQTTEKGQIQHELYSTNSAFLGDSSFLETLLLTSTSDPCSYTRVPQRVGEKNKCFQSSSASQLMASDAQNNFATGGDIVSDDRNIENHRPLHLGAPFSTHEKDALDTEESSEDAQRPRTLQREISSWYTPLMTLLVQQQLVELYSNLSNELSGQIQFGSTVGLCDTVTSTRPGNTDVQEGAASQYTHRRQMAASTGRCTEGEPVIPSSDLLFFNHTSTVQNASSTFQRGNGGPSPPSIPMMPCVGSAPRPPVATGLSHPSSLNSAASTSASITDNNQPKQFHLQACAKGIVIPRTLMENGVPYHSVALVPTSGCLPRVPGTGNQPRLDIKLNRLGDEEGAGPTFWGMWEDERNRMIYVSWLPRAARAQDRSGKKRCELELKHFISKTLGFGGLLKVLLFPPSSAHCKLLFTSEMTARAFLAAFGGIDTDEGPGLWKSLVCQHYNVNIRDGIHATRVRVIWADQTKTDYEASQQLPLLQETSIRKCLLLKDGSS